MLSKPGFRSPRVRLSAPRVAALWVTAMALVATTAASSAIARTVDLTIPSGAHPSGHRAGWSTGVYPGGGMDLRAARSFAHFVGRPLANVHVFVEPSTWHDIGFDSWEVRQYRGFRGQLVIDVPLLPSVEPATLADVAAGRDDLYFKAMAKRLVSLGRGSSVLVLGSEFNGDWQTYSALRPRVYKAAFRHVVTLLRRISPKFVIDWTGNAIDNQAGHNPFRHDWPGNRYVDVVGVDAYAYAESRITNQHSFTRWASLPFGIKAWARFAHRHHKDFSLPEWGLTASDSHWGSPQALGSGDVPAYVRGMYRFMRCLGHRLAFEDYFNDPDGRDRNSLHAPVQMPRSSTRYRTLWSKKPASTSPVRPSHTD